MSETLEKQCLKFAEDWYYHREAKVTGLVADGLAAQLAEFVESAVQSARNEARLEEAEYWYKEWVGPWRADDPDTDDDAQARLRALKTKAPK